MPAMLRVGKYAIEGLRMLYAYIPSQKFNAMKISVFRDIIKIWKKINYIKDVKIYILNNNNAVNLSTNW